MSITVDLSATRDAALQATGIQAVAWGTYDLGKPRTRILLRGLREAGVAITECHADIWSGVEDKSTMGVGRRLIGILLRLILAYPRLIWRYLRLPRHDVVLVAYMGHLDVLLLWPFARLRGIPVVWDAFISLYDTVVQDRRMVGHRHPLARLVWALDWLACRAADLVLLDTQAHARWFQSEFKFRTQANAVFVGAEPNAFAPLADERAKDGEPIRILFYGQFINLHGIETIVEAAARTKPEDYAWTIIGTGQEEPRIRQFIDSRQISNLTWIKWVNYEELRAEIAAADICLGIFGESDKAARVIPNKVFQIIAAGRPLVTRDSPAMRELVDGDNPAIRLVKAGDPDALLRGIAALKIRTQEPHAAFSALREKISPTSIGKRLASLLTDLVGENQR